MRPVADLCNPKSTAKKHGLSIGHHLLNFGLVKALRDGLRDNSKLMAEVLMAKEMIKS